MHDLAFVFSGFMAGLVVCLTGVGGGSLMTPMLMSAFGIKPRLATATGTELLFAPFTKMGGTVRLALQRAIDWRIVVQAAGGQCCCISGNTLCAAAVDWALRAKLLADSLPGIWLGTRLMHKTLACVTRSLLSVLLAYAGAKLR